MDLVLLVVAVLAMALCSGCSKNKEVVDASEDTGVLADGAGEVDSSGDATEADGETPAVDGTAEAGGGEADGGTEG